MNAAFQISLNFTKTCPTCHSATMKILPFPQTVLHARIFSPSLMKGGTYTSSADASESPTIRRAWPGRTRILSGKTWESIASR